MICNHDQRQQYCFARKDFGILEHGSGRSRPSDKRGTAVSQKIFFNPSGLILVKKKIRPPPLDPPLHSVPFDPKPVKERMWLAMIVLHKCFRYFVSTKQMMLALKKLFNSLCETKWSSGRFANCAIFFLVLPSSTVESVTRGSLKY